MCCSYAPKAVLPIPIQNTTRQAAVGLRMLCVSAVFTVLFNFTLDLDMLHMNTLTHASLIDMSSLGIFIEKRPLCCQVQLRDFDQV